MENYYHKKIMLKKQTKMRMRKVELHKSNHRVEMLLWRWAGR